MNRKCSWTRKLFVEVLEDRCVPSAGFLDPTFAADGMTATNFNLPDSQDRAYDVAVYPGSSPDADGKIVAVGATVTRVVRSVWDWDFGLVRYNADGTLDASFGQGGKVTTAMGTGTATDVALSVESLGDKILVGGSSQGRRLCPGALQRQRHPRHVLWQPGQGIHQDRRRRRRPGHEGR
jgi:hypothetical protein